jgi:hypothetical protein
MPADEPPGVSMGRGAVSPVYPIQAPQAALVGRLHYHVSACPESRGHGDLYWM